MGASSGASTMEIDAQGNTWNRMTNQFDEEPRSIDDLFDGVGGGADGVRAAMRA